MNIETLSAEVKRLREQMNDLLDKEAIKECIMRYGRGLDRHDTEILATVYHEDGIDHHGHLFHGTRDNFIEWANAFHEAHWATHTHYMANHLAEIKGDEAYAETYVLFVLRRKEEEKLDLGGGRYLDHLTRREGQWRIATRQIVSDWAGETNAPHVQLPAGVVTGSWDRSDPSYQRPLRVPETYYQVNAWKPEE